MASDSLIYFRVAIFEMLTAIALAMAYGLVAEASELNLRPSIRLSSDAGSIVYPGQVVTLNLDIGLPETFIADNVSLELDIPWLGREFGFRWRLPTEQWICKYSCPMPGTLVCSIVLSKAHAEAVGTLPGRYTLYVPRTDTKPDKVYRLSWQLIVDKPLIGEQLIFAPIAFRLGGSDEAGTSEALSLLVRDPPPPLALRSAVLLPPGRYTISAAIEQTTVFLSEPVELRICISGTGAMENIAPGYIHQGLVTQWDLPLRFLGETWNGEQTRCFRWQWLPESVGTWSIPPVQFLAFDPQTDLPHYEEQATNSLSVTVISPLEPPAKEYVEGMPQLPVRPVRQLDFPWRTHGRVPGYVWFTWIAPPLLWLMLALWRKHRGRPFQFPFYSRHARVAVLALRGQLRRDIPDAYEVWQVVQSYLRQRFQLPTPLNRDELTRMLGLSVMEMEIGRRFADLLESVEQAAFSSSATITSSDIQTLMQLIRELDSHSGLPDGIQSGVCYHGFNSDTSGRFNRNSS